MPPTSSMRFGIMAGATDGHDTLDALLDRAKQVEAAGFSTLWMPNIFSLDAITTLALAGRETSRIELGTAVVPTYPRHPTALAQQALTANAAAGGRFTLGIGLSHQVVIETMLGLSYAKPARHMREYVAVLAPLLRGEPAKFEGEAYRVQAAIEVPGGAPTSLVIAALGPVMLGIAGRFADGTITWMTGPRTIESHIRPTLCRAAKEAGRPEPRVICGLPIALTDDVDGARERIAKTLEMYGMLPSYRAMLDREGVAGPADVALIGGEAELRRQVDRLRDVGVTDFDAAIVSTGEGVAERTFEFLASLL
jgi:5,10-methylenetetrahydromethanopterin reductase